MLQGPLQLPTLCLTPLVLQARAPAMRAEPQTLTVQRGEQQAVQLSILRPSALLVERHLLL